MLIDEIYDAIDTSFADDEINDSTYQCAADILQVCDPEEQETEQAFDTLKELCEMPPSELKEWRKQDIADYKDGLTAEKFCERFKIGSIYSSEEQVLDSTDWSYLITRLLPKLKLLLIESQGKPTTRDIAARLILLSSIQDHCSIYLDNQTQEEAGDIHRDLLANLHNYGLWEHATSEEKKLLETNPLMINFEAAQNTFFSMNAQAEFAWCLGMIDSLPPYDTAISDEDASYSDEFFHNLPSPEHFEIVSSHYKRRSSREIDNAQTEAELWHWRSRTLALQRSKPVAKSSNRSQFFKEQVSKATKTCVAEGFFEAIQDDFPTFGKPYINLDDSEWRKIRIITEHRHKDLNWVCGSAPKNNYDETPTNT